MGLADQKIETRKDTGTGGAYVFDAIKLRAGDNVWHDAQVVHMDDLPRIVPNRFSPGQFQLQARIYFWPFASDNPREILWWWVNLPVKKGAKLDHNGAPRDVDEAVFMEVFGDSASESSNLFKVADALGAFDETETTLDDGAVEVERVMNMRKFIGATCRIQTKDSKDGNYSHIADIKASGANTPAARPWEMPGPKTVDDTNPEKQVPADMVAAMKAQITVIAGEFDDEARVEYLTSLKQLRAKLDPDCTGLDNMSVEAATKMFIELRRQARDCVVDLTELPEKGWAHDITIAEAELATPVGTVDDL